LVDGSSPVLLDCGRKFARWAQDQTELPATTVPAGIAYRDQDNLRPLLRIADQIGREWVERARQAALAINGITRAVGDVVPLLTDIREAFGERERLATREELVPIMLALPEPSVDWNIAYRGGPINEYYLRDRLILRGVINPPAEERRWEVKGTKFRGFLRRHFDDAFARYLPPGEDNLNTHTVAGTPENFSIHRQPDEASGRSGLEDNIQGNSTTYNRLHGPAASDRERSASGLNEKPGDPTGSTALPAGPQQIDMVGKTVNDYNNVNDIRPDRPAGYLHILEKNAGTANQLQPELEQLATSLAGETVATWLPERDGEAANKPSATGAASSLSGRTNSATNGDERHD
jgi:Protein of unknown function (DUF3631)